MSTFRFGNMFVKIACLVVLLLVLCVGTSHSHMDMTAYRTMTSFRDCFSRKHPGVCLKEKALDALNETIMSDKPMVFYDIMKVERNPEYHVNTSEGSNLPEDVKARGMALTDILHDKVEEFWKSRTIKFDMSPAFQEGRGKKDKGKGGMMMLAMGGMACMMAQLFMSKIAFLAGSALIISKVALFLSAIVGLKKLSSGGGGGGESHVVYASEGHSHGGGGWHRSLEGDNTMAYRGHHGADAAANYGY